MHKLQAIYKIKDIIPKLSKEMFFVILGQGMAALGSLIGVRLITEKLLPSSYGEISLALTIGILFQQILFGPLSGSYLRFYSVANEKNEISPFLQAVKKTTFQSSFISFLILGGILLSFLLKGWGQYIGLIIFSFLFMLLSSYNTFLDNLQNAARQRIIVAWHQGIGSWLKYFIAIILIGYLGSSSTVAMGGFMLSALLVFGSQSWFFTKSTIFSNPNIHKNSLETKQWIRSIWQYAKPFIIWGIFTWAQLSSDRWALGLYATKTDVGLYTVLYQIGFYPVTFFSGIILQFLSPIFFQWSGDATQESRMKRTQKFINYIILFSIIFSLLLLLIAFLFHPQILSLLAAPEYQGVSYLLPYMVLAGGIFSSGQFAAMHFLNEIKPEKLLVPKIITSMLGITFNFIFVQYWGIKGIIFAILTYSTIYFFMMLFLVYFHKDKTNGKNIPEIPNEVDQTIY